MSTSNNRQHGMTRRAILIAGTAVPLVQHPERPAWAAEFDYKLATGQDPTHPVNTRALGGH